MIRIPKILAIVLLSLLLVTCNRPSKSCLDDFSGWTDYAGTKSGLRYSSNTHINRENVQELELVWSFSSMDRDSLNRSQNQCNPIVVNGVLYGTSPRSKLLALEADTGNPSWIFDPASQDPDAAQDPMSYYKVNRGVSFWSPGNSEEARVFYNVGNRIYAINAKTGKNILDFGAGGYIDLSRDLDRDTGTFDPFVAGTSPPVIYMDLLITGSRVSESIDAAPGHIRAYDVRTGKRKWIFHTIPWPGEKGYDTWPDPEAYKKLGGANNWAGMSLDEDNGVLFVPTGSISGDFYGGLRAGENLFANSLLALDAASGKYLWHFQVVHHDLWDRDLPANPNLFTLERDGVAQEVVAQITKQGYVFVFDRNTGEPVFEVLEKAVPQGGLPGELPWPTQPVPSLPEPFTDQYFSEDEVGGLTSEDHQVLLDRYLAVAHREPFAPPAREGNWIFPGFDGGGEWGGAAVDVETQVMYVNSSRLPWLMEMVESPASLDPEGDTRTPGRRTYDTYCFACHGKDLKGNGEAYPALDSISKKYDRQQIGTLLSNGLNKMPPFAQIQGEDKEALIDYLLQMEKEMSLEKSKGIVKPAEDSPWTPYREPYVMNGYNRFLDAKGYPGIKPPWGTLTALNLKNGKIAWQVPLGNHDELNIPGVERTGTENYGGPLVTKGGLVFIAATKDSKLHAFDKETGELLWEADLPAAGYATPATYVVDGRQYVVIACGGGKIGSPSGDQYVAFALPVK